MASSTPSNAGRRPGESARLVAIDLVGGVEDRMQLGMGIEHVLVEQSGDGLAMHLQDRHGGLDGLDLFGRQRHDRCNSISVMIAKIL